MQRTATIPLGEYENLLEFKKAIINRKHLEFDSGEIFIEESDEVVNKLTKRILSLEADNESLRKHISSIKESPKRPDATTTYNTATMSIKEKDSWWKLF